MNRLFWVNGRLSWPLVAAVVFISLTLVIMDIAWRVLIIPFEALFVYSAVASLVAAICLIGLFVLIRRGPRVL